MTTSDMVAIAQNTKWTKINNFSINILFASGFDGNKGPIDFAKMCGWDDTITNDILNSSIISVNTPQYTNALVNQYVSYEWRYHQGRDELYRFSMTFRDFNQMKLFNIFRKIYIKSKDQYFDKIKMNIKVFLDEDFGVTQVPIFQTTSAIIENVSQLQFSHNTENQIAEFTVNFVCNTIELNGINTVSAGSTGNFTN